MKIAVNATIIDDKPTGLGIYAYHVAHELSKFLELFVITSHSAPFKGNPNIRVIKAPEIVQPGKGKMGAIARLLWLNLVLPGLLKKEKIDLLINLTHHGLFFPPIPQTLTIHDLIPLRFPSQYRLQNYYYRFLTPFLIRKSLAVNTLTKSMKREIAAAYHIDPAKVLVSGCGYNAFSGDDAARQQDKENYILMVGASFRHKNFDRVVEAYSRSEALQKYELRIAGGRGDYLNYLKALSGKLQVQGKVTFIDYAEPEHLAELYRNATAFVYPSLYEGFGLPPLEAMQLGTAVAASGIASIREVCEDAVSYFDPNSVEDIREKLELLTGDEGLRSGLVKKGFEQIKKHTWSSVAERIYEFISSHINSELS